MNPTGPLFVREEVVAQLRRHGWYDVATGPCDGADCVFGPPLQPSKPGCTCFTSVLFPQRSVLIVLAKTIRDLAKVKVEQEAHW